MAATLGKIKFLISVIAITILVLVVGLAHYASRDLSYRTTDGNARAAVMSKLNYIQGAAESLLRFDMSVILEQVVSGLAAEPDLLNLLIVTRDNIVLSSNNFSETGRNWQLLDLDLDENLVLRVKQAKRTLLNHDTAGRYMEGYVSVCSEADSALLRSDDCGFAVYRINLAYHYALSRQALYLQTLYFALGITFSIAVIFGLLHVWLNRPANHIIESLERFNRGEHERRIEVKNNNEITQISRAVNLVLDTVVRDEKSLQNKEARLRAIFDNTVDAIITIDSRGIVQSANPATRALLGYTRAELVGQNVSVITPQPHRERHDDYIRRYLESGQSKIIGNGRELLALTRDGKTIPISLTLSEMEIDGERCFTGIIRDITEQVKLREAMSSANAALRSSNDELARRSKTDPLTGIANRRAFDETLEHEIRRATRRRLPLSLLLLDIDYFKPYNDFYGHVQGDQCLQTVAAALQQHCNRAGELAARYGGEEFAVILPGADAEEAYLFAERLRQAIWALELEHEKSRIGNRVTVSIGAASLPAQLAEPLPPVDLITLADRALYEAKGAGRNRVIAAEPEDRQTVRSRQHSKN